MSDGLDLGSGPESPRALWLLGVGVLLGLGVAAAGLLVGAPGSAGGLPPGAVALVNGEIIETAELLQALQAVEGDRRVSLDPDEKRIVLERLIDEELLLQRALALNLLRHDRKLRSDLVSALVESVVADSSDRPPAPAELERFFAEQRDYFHQPGRLHVRELHVAQAPGESLEATRERAVGLAERLRAGAPAPALQREIGDAPVAPPPDAPLPPAKLREYLGATGLRAALALEPGEVAEPLRIARGFRVIQLVAREPDRVPRLDEIESTVRAEWRRRAGERALRAYLDRLRASAELAVAATLP